MTAKLAKFDFNQGFNRETTQYAEEGNWFDGDRVRFRAGRPENIRGYETKVSTAFDGSARDLIAWKDNSNKKRAIFGTPDKLYEHNGDSITDITPITTIVTLTNCLVQVQEQPEYAVLMDHMEDKRMIGFYLLQQLLLEVM